MHTPTHPQIRQKGVFVDAVWILLFVCVREGGVFVGGSVGRVGVWACVYVGVLDI